MRELVQVFYEPGKVFEAVRDRGTWIPAFIAVSLVGVLVYFAMMQLMGAGNLARKPFEGNSRLAAMVPPEAIEKAAADAEKPARKAMGMVFAAVGQGVALLVIAGLFTGLTSIMNRRAGFWKMVGAVSYAWFPVSVVGGVLMVVTLLLSGDPADMDPQNLVATNVSMFLSDESSKPLRAFLGTLDLLSFARMGLLSLGISKVASMPFRQSLGLVAGLWMVYVIGRVGVSFFF